MEAGGSARGRVRGKGVVNAGALLGPPLPLMKFKLLGASTGLRLAREAAPGGDGAAAFLLPSLPPIPAGCAVSPCARLHRGAKMSFAKGRLAAPPQGPCSAPTRLVLFQLFRLDAVPPPFLSSAAGCVACQAFPWQVTGPRRCPSRGCGRGRLLRHAAPRQPLATTDACRGLPPLPLPVCPSFLEV